jgi:hypothetical protein
MRMTGAEIEACWARIHARNMGPLTPEELGDLVREFERLDREMRDTDRQARRIRSWATYDDKDRMSMRRRCRAKLVARRQMKQEIRAALARGPAPGRA